MDRPTEHYAQCRALDALLGFATDLCDQEAGRVGYDSLLGAVQHFIPFDAAAVMVVNTDGSLSQVAGKGLAPELAGQHLVPSEHPRLQRILEARDPIRFSYDCPLPDPFDGRLLGDNDATRAVHSCMGTALRIEGHVVGALTVDAFRDGAFGGISDKAMATFGALLAAAVRNARLADRLAALSSHQQLIVNQLSREASERSGNVFVGTSPLAQKVRDDIELVADTELAVLITGETGVGKEVVARAVHAQSLRRDKQLIYVNCAALPETIAESELFGHVRGAFTGASDNRAGKFEVANGGTIFLDEVGELPLAIQPKLLRILQTGEVQRVGSDQTTTVDVRVIAATNRDLADDITTGRFRRDLFHRLGVYPLHIPPLRERRSDIVELAGHFLDLARVKLGGRVLRLTAAARHTLGIYDWPGNVRELDNVLTRAALRASREQRSESIVIDNRHLELSDQLHPLASSAIATMEAIPMSGSLVEDVDAFKRARIEAAVARAGGNHAAAARLLGLDRANLLRLARRLGLQR